MFYFLPVLFFYFGASSYSLGYIIIALLLFFKNSNPLILSKSSIYFLITILFSILFFPIFKAVASFFVLIYLAFNKKFIYIYLTKFISNKLHILINISYLILLNPYQPLKQYHKSIFPFTEPSHFIIWLAPFYLIYSSKSEINIYKRLLLILIIFFHGIFLPNATFLVVTMMCVFVIVWTFFKQKENKKFFISILLGSIISIFTLIFILSTNYFTSRLGQDDSNLTFFTYQLGLEYINYAIKNFPYGIGFQNAGNINTGDMYNYFKYQLEYIPNLNDGSFLASKILIEFGFPIGCLLIFYLIYTKKSNFKYLWAFKLTLIVELILRGYGYFSGNFIINLIL